MGVTGTAEQIFGKLNRVRDTEMQQNVPVIV